MNERFPVLLTDDEPGILSLYQAFLARQKIPWIATPDSLEALAICQSQPVTLVISDMNKPHLTGLELLRILRAHPQTSQLPFVMITAVPTPELRRNFVEAGGNLLLAKPLQRQAFLSAIHQLLNDQAAVA